MAPNSLSPASVVISYHSAYSAHRMTIPTLAWIPVGFAGDLGGYASWNASARDAEAMIGDLVAKLKVLVPATTLFDEATIYTMATPTSPNIPRASKALAVAGTSASTDPSAAVSATFNMKTGGNGNSKIVLLDVPIGNNWFAPIFPADFTTALTDVFDQMNDPNNAWAGRDDEQIQSFRSVTFDLNDKLQKQYWR